MNGRRFALTACAAAALAMGALAWLSAAAGAGGVLPLALLVGGLVALIAALWSLRVGERSREAVHDKTVAHLERRVAALEELAVRDPLTGLYNRRALLERLAQEIARSRRHGGVLSAVILDIDHFKAINDRYGHAAGDAVLFAVAAHFGDHVRSTDLVARYGGEEFVMLLPHTNREGAAAIAGRIVRAVAAEPIAIDRDEKAELTISAGIATYPEDGEDGDTLLKVADEALYAAKRAGRNQVGTAAGEAPSRSAV